MRCRKVAIVAGACVCVRVFCAEVGRRSPPCGRLPEGVRTALECDCLGGTASEAAWCVRLCVSWLDWGVGDGGMEEINASVLPRGNGEAGLAGWDFYVLK